MNKQNIHVTFKMVIQKYQLVQWFSKWLRHLDKMGLQDSDWPQYIYLLFTRFCKTIGWANFCSKNIKLMHTWKEICVTFKGLSIFCFAKITPLKNRLPKFNYKRSNEYFRKRFAKCKKKYYSHAFVVYFNDSYSLSLSPKVK